MLKRITSELEQLASIGQARQLHPTHHHANGAVEIRGRRVLDLTSWDFLGINGNPRFRNSIQRDVDALGLGISSPRSAAGNHQRHIACEYRLAQFMGTQSAVLFSSKNQVVLSLVTSLVTEGDTIYVEESMQSPVSDAAYLVNAQVVTYESHALSLLKAELAKGKGFGRRIIFAESLSPATGVQTDLRAIGDIARASDSSLIVDESYALGSIGLRGAGGLEAAGLANTALCAYASVSYALACYGAFAAGSAALAGYLVNRSKTFISEPPLPPALATAIETALEIAELSPVQREHTRLKAAKLRGALKAMGLRKIEGEDSPVICIPTPKLSQAQEIAEAFFHRGFLVEALPKGVPKSDSALVRLLVSPHLGERQIEELLSASSDIFRMLAQKTI